MTEPVTGAGELTRNGEFLCRVSYQLQRHEGGDETRFTLTDGVIEIEQPSDSEAVIELEPGVEFTLQLEKPLRDGRETLTLVVEPYAGHRPDERYQVRIKEDAR